MTQRPASEVFTAIFERDEDGYWLVRLREERGVSTFGKTLERARFYIAEAAELWYERPVTLREEIRLPREIKQSVTRAQRERDRVAAAQEASSLANRDAAHRLVDDAHLPLRDAAAVLGLSHQRVAQLLAM